MGLPAASSKTRRPRKLKTPFTLNIMFPFTSVTVKLPPVIVKTFRTMARSIEWSGKQYWGPMMPLGTACWCSAISGALVCAEEAMTKILKRLTQNLRKFVKFLIYVTIDDNSFLLKTKNKKKQKKKSEINLFYCFWVDFLRALIEVSICFWWYTHTHTHIYISGHANLPLKMLFSP